jgi:glutathione synthase/RimK-type ligase-like ATP-grasp enzyme
MDKDKLSKYFKENGYEAVFVPLPEVNFRKNEMIDIPVLYTSQEDPGYFYKNYIEDIVFGLELSGAKVIPQYKYLRANNNKVFMEILRDQMNLEGIKNIHSFYFGTLEEAMSKADEFKFPVVVKGASGAMGKNVMLAKNKKELNSTLRRIAASRNLGEELREIVRSRKYNGYLKQSKFRNKFVIQNFIPELKNDWKVYVFGQQIYIFYRPIFRHRGFRASGGGYDNYFYGNDAKIPEGLFEYAFNISKYLNTPFVSLDIAQTKDEFFLLEFQLVYFGTAGILKKYSKEYFIKKNNNWIEKSNSGDIEKVYVEGVITYLEQ